MPPKKKKGKGKGKKKISKEQREQIELERASELIKNDKAKYKEFISRVDRWLISKGDALIDRFRLFDESGKGLVTYRELKQGLRDHQVPCNNAEIYLLCTLLDVDNMGHVYYGDISNGLQFVHHIVMLEEERSDLQTRLKASQKEFDHCPGCGIALHNPPKLPACNYLHLELKFVPLLHIRKHSSHVWHTFTAECLVQSVVDWLTSYLDIATNTLALFKDAGKGAPVSHRLPAHETLEACGYPGGTYQDPQHAVLLYDYAIDFADAPLLCCDYFFLYKLEDRSRPRTRESETTLDALDARSAQGTIVAPSP